MGKNIKIILITQDNEIDISSNLIILIFYLKKVVGIDPDITVIDNNSKDRTVKLIRNFGLDIYRYKVRKTRKVLVETAFNLAKQRNLDILIILDLAGGNTSDDAISLMARGIDEGSRFASAYIQPRKGDGYLGCWALNSQILYEMGPDIDMNLRKYLLEYASSENMEVLAIDELFSVNSKKQRNNMFNLFRRSPLEMISALVKYHPLLFYGMIGMTFLLVAIFSGIITINWFYTHHELNYMMSFLTVALVMIGGFFMVAGLMLNALNIIIEKLEAMKSWL